jgi:hypothetical protein
MKPKLHSTQNDLREKTRREAIDWPGVARRTAI